MNTTMQCTSQQRRRFVGFVVACIVGTYLYGTMTQGIPLYTAPFWTIVLYGSIWFANSVMVALWLVLHILFMLACRWLLRCDEPRTYFFTLLLACAINYWPALGASYLSRLALMHSNG